MSHGLRGTNHLGWVDWSGMDAARGTLNLFDKGRKNIRGNPCESVAKVLA